MEAWSYGHSKNCRGSNGYVDEVDVCSLVFDEVLKIAESEGRKSIVNVSNDLYKDSDVRGKKTAKANAHNCDWYISIHANWSYFNSNTSTTDPVGVECWVYEGNKESKRVANAFCSNIASLGFKNRGVKENRSLTELCRPNGNAIIIELFFVNSAKDVEIFKQVGAKEMARQIYGAMYGFPKNRKTCPTCGQEI